MVTYTVGYTCELDEKAHVGLLFGGRQTVGVVCSVGRAIMWVVCECYECTCF